MNITSKRSTSWTRRDSGLMMKTPNAFMRLKHIACSEKHICDHARIWMRRSVICVGALRWRANRKPNPLNLFCVSIYDLYELRQSADKYRPQLGEIYASFREGFDTTDLARAKARLKNPSPTW